MRNLVRSRDVDRHICKRGLACGMLVMVMLAAGACTVGEDNEASPEGGAARAQGITAEQESSIPAEQQEFFDDGEVTLAEYQLAWSNWVECVDENGGYLRGEVDEVTGEIRFEADEPDIAPTGGGEGPVNQCYQRYFAQAEIAFSSTNPVVLGQAEIDTRAIFDDLALPCLTALGVGIPPDLQYQDENWLELYSMYNEAVADGHCSVE